MSRMLSQEEIDRLIKEKERAEKAQAESLKAHGAIPYDFRKPNRLSKEQLRSFHTVHENFARQLGSNLSTQLRTVVKINPISVEQVAYADYVASLPNPDSIYIFNVSPVEGKAIMEINPQMVFALIERMLGGKGELPETIRDLTEIEQNLMRKIVDQAFVDLKEAWKHLYELDFSLDSTETTPQFVWIVPPMESTILITFEIQTQYAFGVMTICYPYIVIKPIIVDLSSRYMPGSGGETEEKLFDRAIYYTNVDVSAVLSEVQFEIEDIMDLREGDIIILRKHVSEPLTIKVDGVPEFIGKMGIKSGKYAVEVLGMVKKDEDDLKVAAMHNKDGKSKEDNNE